MAVKGTVTVPNTGTVTVSNNKNKEVVFKNSAPFADCISEINNARINYAKDTGVVMTVHNLIEYCENYSQTSGSLWLYYRDQPALDNNGKIIDSPVDNSASLSFKYREKCNWQDRKWWHKKYWYMGSTKISK